MELAVYRRILTKFFNFLLEILENSCTLTYEWCIGLLNPFLQRTYAVQFISFLLVSDFGMGKGKAFVANHILEVQKDLGGLSADTSRYYCWKEMSWLLYVRNWKVVPSNFATLSSTLVECCTCHGSAAPHPYYYC